MSVAAARVDARRRRLRLQGRLFRWFLFLSLAVGIVTLAALLVQVVVKGVQFLDLVLLLEPPSADPARARARAAEQGAQ
jgi:hypothetical protein